DRQQTVDRKDENVAHRSARAAADAPFGFPGKDHDAVLIVPGLADSQRLDANILACWDTVITRILLHLPPLSQAIAGQAPRTRATTRSRSAGERALELGRQIPSRKISSDTSPPNRSAPA